MQRQPSDAAQGIDVSQYQGNIDWPAVATTGISFAYIRAVAGATVSDPTFAANWNGAKATGIIPGAYGFAYPQTSSAIAEAAALHDAVQAVGGWSGSLGPAVDIEGAGCAGIDKATMTQWVRDWLDHIRELSGIYGRIYGSPDFLANAIDTTQFTDTELWVAHDGVPQPDDAGAWTSWTFWQHTSSGHIQGISGNVDLDYYAGTVDELRAKFAPQAKPAAKPAPHQGGEDVQVPELREGVKGHEEAVKAVQGAVGANPIDGVFGTETTGAVKRFQSSHGLSKDGVVGAHTWSKILA